MAAEPQRGVPGRLSEFFRQWFDTAYPPGGGANRPGITGPGLAGPGFYTEAAPGERRGPCAGRQPQAGAGEHRDRGGGTRAHRMSGCLARRPGRVW